MVYGWTETWPKHTWPTLVYTEAPPMWVSVVGGGKCECGGWWEVWGGGVVHVAVWGVLSNYGDFINQLSIKLYGNL